MSSNYTYELICHSNLKSIEYFLLDNINDLNHLIQKNPLFIINTNSCIDIPIINSFFPQYVVYSMKFNSYNLGSYYTCHKKCFIYYLTFGYCCNNNEQYDFYDDAMNKIFMFQNGRLTYEIKIYKK